VEYQEKKEVEEGSSAGEETVLHRGVGGS